MIEIYNFHIPNQPGIGLESVYKVISGPLPLPRRTATTTEFCRHKQFLPRNGGPLASCHYVQIPTFRVHLNGRWNKCSQLCLNNPYSKRLKCSHLLKVIYEMFFQPGHSKRNMSSSFTEWCLKEPSTDSTIKSRIHPEGRQRTIGRQCVSAITCEALLWIYPPPRMPVNTRIITFLLGRILINLHFPLLLGAGRTNICIYKYLYIYSSISKLRPLL